MFKLNYKQFLSLPVALVKYGNRSWLYEKILVWNLPGATRDFTIGIFVLSFCFIRHRSSHYLLLYVIISFSIYYYWVRFLQLEYTEPFYGQLQFVLDLAYDIKYLSHLIAFSPIILGLFSHICTIGLYLFYAGKSILLTTEKALMATSDSRTTEQLAGALGVPSCDSVALGVAKNLTSGSSAVGALLPGNLIEDSAHDPAIEAAANYLGVDLGAFKALLALKGFAPWFESVKNSSAGFFPISMTSLLHLQFVKDPEVLKPLREAAAIVPTLLEPETGSGFSPYPVLSDHGYWVSSKVQFWLLAYKAACTSKIYGMPGKYISFAYLFDNKGTAPFFGRFTNDLELINLLGNFPFEKFSLLEFFTFSFRTAFRLWIPLFCVGYKDALAWWIHPYSELSLINVVGYSRYIFEPFMIAISLVLENSIQQIYASFYMDRLIFPAYYFLNHWNKLRPATLEDTREAFLTSLSGAAFEAGSVSELMPLKWANFKPTKFSQMILTLGGYIVKYAPIYVPAEEARIRNQLLIFEIIFLRPFIIVFKILTFGLNVFAWLVYDSFIHFIPEIVFDPFFGAF